MTIAGGAANHMQMLSLRDCSSVGKTRFVVTLPASCVQAYAAATRVYMAGSMLHTLMSTPDWTSAVSPNTL